MAFITITVALLKGGVGKTTTAIALAEAAALMGPAILIDADPMGSAFEGWSQRAALDGSPLRAEVIPTSPTALDADPYELSRIVEAAKRQADVVVIDAPPPGRNHITEAALAVSDVLVMPTTPGWQDLDRVPSTVALATANGRPAFAVLTQVRAGLPERDQARKALAEAGAVVLDTELPLSVAVQRNYGLPATGPLARFGTDLLTELLERTEPDGTPE